MAHVKDILLERILTGPGTCGLNPLHVKDTWTLGNVWVRVKIAGKLCDHLRSYWRGGSGATSNIIATSRAPPSIKRSSLEEMNGGKSRVIVQADAQLGQLMGIPVS